MAQAGALLHRAEAVVFTFLPCLSMVRHYMTTLNYIIPKVMFVLILILPVVS